VKKGHNGRKSLRRLKPTVGCNDSKREEEEEEEEEEKEELGQMEE
jgi:hypothetical protein